MQSSYGASFRTMQRRRLEPMTRDSGCKKFHHAGLAGGFGCSSCGGNGESKQTSPQLWFQDRASQLAYIPHQRLNSCGTVLGEFYNATERSKTSLVVVYSVHIVAAYKYKVYQKLALFWCSLPNSLPYMIAILSRLCLLLVSLEHHRQGISFPLRLI